MRRQILNLSAAAAISGMSAFYSFAKHQLDPDHILWQGAVPEEILGSSASFQALWDLHPKEFHDIKMHGRDLKTPRWQQAYDRDYKYSGSKNTAMPCPSEMKSFFDWSKAEIDEQFNGLLVNWYDGALGHYIGKHRDKANDLIPGAPIVTISLGETRQFRMRPWKGTGYQDFEASHGSVFILPFETNQSWTHEVPKSSQYQGRRLSITIRAFR